MSNTTNNEAQELIREWDVEIRSALDEYGGMPWRVRLTNKRTGRVHDVHGDTLEQALNRAWAG